MGDRRSAGPPPAAAASPGRKGREGGTRRRRPGRGARRGRTLKFPADPPPAATTPPRLSTSPAAARPRPRPVPHPLLDPRGATPGSYHPDRWQIPRWVSVPPGTPGQGRGRARVPPPSPLASGLRVWERPRGGARRGRLYSSAPRPGSSWQEVRPWWPGKWKSGLSRPRHPSTFWAACQARLPPSPRQSRVHLSPTFPRLVKGKSLAWRREDLDSRGSYFSQLIQPSCQENP